MHLPEEEEKKVSQREEDEDEEWESKRKFLQYLKEYICLPRRESKSTKNKHSQIEGGISHLIFKLGMLSYIGSGLTHSQYIHVFEHYPVNICHCENCINGTIYRVFSFMKSIYIESLYLLLHTDIINFNYCQI